MIHSWVNLIFSSSAATMEQNQQCHFYFIWVRWIIERREFRFFKILHLSVVLTLIIFPDVRFRPKYYFNFIKVEVHASIKLT